jgi:hypothetical protein
MDMGGIHTSGGLHTTPAVSLNRLLLFLPMARHPLRTNSLDLQFMHSTAVHISVEQHQQGDMEMETKNSSQGKRSFDTFPAASRSR